MGERESEICPGVALNMARKEHGKNDLSKAEFSSTIHICFHRLMGNAFGETFYSRDSMECIQNMSIRGMRRKLKELIEDSDKVNIKVYCMVEYIMTQWFATRTVRGLSYCPNKIRCISEVLNGDGFIGEYADRVNILMKDFVSAEYDEATLKDLEYMTRDIEAEVYEEFASLKSQKRGKRGLPAFLAQQVLSWGVSKALDKFSDFVVNASEKPATASEALNQFSEYVAKAFQKPASASEGLDRMFRDWDSCCHINTMCTYIYHVTPQTGYTRIPGEHESECFRLVENDKYDPKVVSIEQDVRVIPAMSWTSAKLGLALMFKTLMVGKMGESDAASLITYKLNTANVKIRYDFLEKDHDACMKKTFEDKLSTDDYVLPSAYREFDCLLESGQVIKNPKFIGEIPSDMG